MKAFLKSHKKLGAAVGLIVLSIASAGAWSSVAPLRGRIAARVDLRRGHYKLLTYGLPPMGFPQYADLLKEKYGIEVQPVAGCVVTPTLVSYVDAYDAVSAEAANKKFGHDIFKEAWAYVYAPRSSPTEKIHTE